MTEVNPVESVEAVAGLAEAVLPTVPASVRPIITMLSQFLNGKVQVHDGVALESSNVLNLRLSMIGDVVHVEMLDPKPLLDLNFIVTLKRNIDGVKLSADSVQCEIAGLPDPTFAIEK